MKRVFAITLILASVVFSVIPASAQKYKPKDKWPFVYSEFSSGNVRTQGGVLLHNATELNVSVASGKLHYLAPDKKIMEADMRMVYSALIGQDVYLNANGRMMKVLAEAEGCAVLEDTSVDVEEYGKVNIGYGISSSTASSEDKSNILMTLGQVVDMNVEEAKLSKEGGKELPLQIKKYIWAQNKAVPASKVDVLELYNVDKNELNAFVKANKIKWNDVQSLLKVAEFLSK